MGGKIRIAIKRRYYKRSRPGQSPMVYTASQPKGVGTAVKAMIMIDPILKNHPKLEEAFMVHELGEIIKWAQGFTGSQAHRHARSLEPRATRMMSLSVFWKKVKSKGGKG